MMEKMTIKNEGTARDVKRLASRLTKGDILFRGHLVVECTVTAELAIRIKLAGRPTNQWVALRYGASTVVYKKNI